MILRLQNRYLKERKFVQYSNTKTFQLTISQQDIYFDQQHNNDSPLYNIGGILRLKSANLAAIQAAHKDLVIGHDAFGIRITELEGLPVQYLSNSRTLDLPLIDFSAESDPHQASQVWLESLFETPLEFQEAELFRAYLLKISTENYLYVGLAHHLMADGWGFANWAQYVVDHIHQDNPSSASQTWPEVVKNDLAFRKSKRYQNAHEFWKLKLKEEFPPLFSAVYDVDNGSRSRRHIKKLPIALCRAINQFSVEHKLSLNQVFMAIWAGYLARSSQKNSFLLGLPVHNRSTREDKHTIGVFTSVTPLAIAVDESLSLIGLAQYLTRQVKQSFRFQRFPVQELRRFTGANHRLFDAGFNFLDLGAVFGAVKHKPDMTYLSHNHSKTPLMLTVWSANADEAPELQLDHNLNFFSAEEAELICERLCYIAAQVIKAPSLPIEQWPLIAPKEQKLLDNLRQGRTATELLETQPADVFQLTAQRLNHRTALVCDGMHLTYKDLAQQTQIMANNLAAFGICQGDLVGVCLPRCNDVIIVQMALWRLGAGFVYLSPDLPEQRLAYVVKDSGISALVVDQKSPFGSDCKIQVKLFCLADDVDTEIAERAFAKQTGINNSVAYVIYTSGTTGDAKGVPVTFRNLMSYYSGFLDQLSLLSNLEHIKWLSGASLSFDASLKNLLLLMRGGCCYLLNNEQHADIEQISRLISSEKIDIINFIPRVLTQVLSTKLQHFPNLICSGDKISKVLYQQISEYCQAHNRIALNAYGPTETTINSTFSVLGSRLSIGQPLANTQCIVVDKQNRILPLGCVGELLIGGPAVVAGYLNRDALTSLAFVEFKHANGSTSRMYHSGDLVRLSPSEGLQFIGRNDKQYKIRGNRVELGEIVHELDNLDVIDGHYLKVEEDQEGHHSLTLFVKASPNWHGSSAAVAENVRELLLAKLPSYAIPELILAVKDWPLTTSGKIDASALPSWQDTLSVQNILPPSTETESQLVMLWSQLLDLAPEKISTTANFFTLGGHSLLITKLVALIRTNLQKSCEVKNVFQAPVLVELAKVLDKLPSIDVQPKLQPISISARKNVISHGQQRLWFLQELDLNNTQYNMSGRFWIKGEIDFERLQSNLATLLNRHEILRTVYLPCGETLTTSLLNSSEFKLKHFDLSQSVDKDMLLQDIMVEEAATPFNLASDFVFRATLVSGLNDNEHSAALLLTLHHIASDGWSVRILINDLKFLYESNKLTTQALPLQYADYAHWQRTNLTQAVLQRHTEYWQEQLKDAPALHALPIKDKRPEGKSEQGRLLRKTLPLVVSQQVQALATNLSMTPYMLFHAALGILLSRHGNTQDIVIGMPVANRMHPSLETLVGFFVNCLVLRTSTSFNTLSEYLQHVREVNIDAQAHQDMPFELLVERLKVARNNSFTPLFQIILTSDTDYGVGSNDAEKVSLADCELFAMADEQAQLKFDLEIDISTKSTGLQITWRYDPALFDDFDAEQMLEQLCYLIEQYTDLNLTPELPLQTLELLNGQQKQQCLTMLNKNLKQYDCSELIHQRFERQASQYAQCQAVSYDGLSINYAELNIKANQLARTLLSSGIKPRSKVAICMERGHEVIVAILAVLKAGCTYVPIDPTTPQLRIDHILEDSKPEIILTTEHYQCQFNVGDIIVLDSDEVKNRIQAQQCGNLADELTRTSQEQAYIIYTSGSTGNPKGVMVTHANVNRLFQSAQAGFSFDNNDVWTLFHSYAFDFSVWEIWGALFYGGHLVVVPQAVTQDPVQLYDLLIAQGVTVFNQTPSSFYSFSEVACQKKAISTLRYIVFGGEALNLAKLAPWYQSYSDKQPQLVNMYGITETTVHVTYRQISSADCEATGSYIGQLLPDLAGVICAPDGALCPPGASGELFVGGAGVTQGYLNNPAMTLERFIHLPVAAELAPCFYRTGDLVRYKNNELEYLGRIDQQVKIRGFRIELGEIEQALTDVELVKSAIAFVTESSSGDKKIVAFYQLKEGKQPDINQLLFVELKKRLPYYMLPTQLTSIASWPLTSNGKIDQNQLVAQLQELSNERYEVPVGTTETNLVNAVAKLLAMSVDKISRQDNFFQLGGHSLLVVKLINEIEHCFTIKLTVADIYQSQTMVDIADKIEGLLMVKKLSNNIKDCELESEGWL